MERNMEGKGNFGEGKVWRHIISQALPLTLAQLVQILYNLVDRIYIGHLPGDAQGLALTGVGVTFPVITLIAAFTNLFASGGAPLCSMARGKKDDKRALEIMGCTLFMQILVGIIVGVAAFLTMKPLLYLLGASDATYPYAAGYLRIYLLGTVFLMVGTGMNLFINLQGFPKIGMMTTLLGAILNIILDPVFIFVFKMGVEGAAIATVISQFVSAVWVISFLFGKKAVLRISREYIKPRILLIKDIVILGMAGFVMQATNCIVQAVCNASLGYYGGDVYIGIMTILNSVREILGLPVGGLASGGQPVLSYNYGAGENKRVKEAIKFLSLVGSCYMLVVWLIIMLFPSFFIRLFSSDIQMVTYGNRVFMIYFGAFFMMQFQFIGQSTFTALGKSKQAIFFSIFRKVIIVLPLTLLLPGLGFGTDGVFIAEPISNVIGGLACFITMLVTVYRKLDNKPD